MGSSGRPAKIPSLTGVYGGREVVVPVSSIPLFVSWANSLMVFFEHIFPCVGPIEIVV